ncbi:diguanylate cyclase (GGDEF)-like protein/PAS domain S-box-containing protein [Salibacterium salarium]|uniref:sensor domain-containing protein n=1 Tax=Salibacterium salarium TaxID=284579 RepID=UPI00277DEDE6|nr:diguanylate cyclase [Salibacterium salarium]MDQ0298471.1 diguanylate cyclase (GGDEF)-like protein/PAS domain S-box-containing protein [Salibacterium salarium]
MLTNWITNIEDGQYLDMIFNNISDMVFLLSMNDDGSFQYVTANQTAVETLHFPKNFRGKQVSSLMPPASAQVITEKYREAITKQTTITYQTKIEFPTSRGAESTRFNYVESKVTPILNNQGKYEHIIAVTRDVTDWVEQERQLKQVNKQVELMFNHAADAVFMFDHKADYTKVNQGFTNLFGWTEKELVRGKNISILPPTDNDFPNIFEQLQTGNVIQNHHSKRVTKEGQTVDVLASYSPIIEEDRLVGGVALYKDITDMKRMQDRVRESEERYRAIANHTNDLIRTLDRDGIIQYASPSHERVLGMPADFYVGKSVLSFAHPDDMGVLQNMVEHIVQTGESAETEYRRFHKNRDIIWVEAKGTPVMDSKEYVEQIIIVARDISKRKDWEEELMTLALHDELTQLPNRRLFQQELKHSIEDVKRNNSELAILTMDCDDFKSINDQYGHDVGDEVIKGLAQRINQSLRSTDMVSRMGGDEFHALLTDIYTSKEGELVAERILHEMAKPFHIWNHTLYLTISIGITFYHGHQTVEQLFKESDKALYNAKMTGKNMYCIYDS